MKHSLSTWSSSKKILLIKKAKRKKKLKRAISAVLMMDTMISVILVSEDLSVIILENSSSLEVLWLEHHKSGLNSKLESSNAGLVVNLAKKSFNNSNTQNPRSVYLKTVIKILGNSKCQNLSLQISKRSEYNKILPKFHLELCQDQLTLF